MRVRDAWKRTTGDVIAWINLTKNPTLVLTVIPRHRRTQFSTPCSFFYSYPNKHPSHSPLRPLYFPCTRPTPFKCPMARPFDEACARHPTPPLSPSRSLGSSRGSSAPSLSPYHLSSHLPRDIDHSHTTCPDSQPLKHCNSTLMPDDHNHDPMILDDWEEEQRERPERGQGKHILEIGPFSNFYSIPGALGLLK